MNISWLDIILIPLLIFYVWDFIMVRKYFNGKRTKPEPPKEPTYTPKQECCKNDRPMKQYWNKENIQ